MSLDKKIKVLVVDDSKIFREVLARGISSDPQIEVVATASDPYDARDKILKFRPDVMTYDVEMPKINGMELIRRLFLQNLIPVIVISAASKVGVDAMSAGAVDFVAKPEVQSPKAVEKLINNIISKIKIAAFTKISRKANLSVSNKIEKDTVNSSEIIAIGASTGGTEAIYNLLSQLPNTIPGIVIVQHIPPMFSQMFAQRLDATTKLKVKEAQTGDFLEQGKVLVAPGNHHMKIKKIGSRYKVECYQGDKVNGHCPSVDVLFESVAKECGSKAIGIILTGMGNDGAKGLLAMRKQGARTIGQDEKTSVVYGMPKVAFNIGAVEKQAPLDRIPDVLLSMLK
ncbi:MAG: chemotaxis response regulator protein-glutamate methylesterase [Clostridiales bacterium]|nr:chemotaxis response regulator protein-glutamate methylesterase [Clostridiales bacterium]